MNETLNRWTFNFHKVLRQQNSGAVEDFILADSAVYLRIQKWKNYWNRSTFTKVIVKIKLAPFLMAHGVDIGPTRVIGNSTWLHADVDRIAPSTFYFSHADTTHSAENVS